MLEMLEILAIILGFIIVIIIVILRSGIKKVNQYEKGIIERWNAYEKTVEPGLRVIIPFVQRMFRVNMREQVIDVPPQEIITEDNVVVTIDAVIFYQVVEAKRAIYEVEDFELAIVKLAQTTLRNIVGEMSLDICLTSREKINLELRKVLDEATDKWGTKVNRIELQRIDPPADIQQAMHKQKTAEQERRQIRLLATGRKEASAQDKEGTILKAEGDKQAAVLTAEGKAKAIELVAKAQAEAVKVVSEAANKYFKENAQLNKKLDVVRDTFSQQTKIVVPSSSDILNVIGLEGTPVLPIKSSGKKKTETKEE
ncbi:MAG: paraslipin [Candidatus Bathyarchaeota archaeon]|nr:paraslipin [Candidatus Bathyarchaeota archaeon]MDH5746951.1 paraslipin [Candidatus Bathyarchaeota archaeon]